MLNIYEEAIQHNAELEQRIADRTAQFDAALPLFIWPLGAERRNIPTNKS
jgi:hypothetical protein